MKMIVGLGNIGPHFDGTRHNVGFMVLNAIAGLHGLEWQHKDKFKANIAELNLNRQKVILVQPTTFYNLSGEAALAVKQFYKIDSSDIAVVHDELALPLGTIRSRFGGSDAGNNGIKSVSSTIGSDYTRVRVGIANAKLPVIGATDFVIGRFAHAEHPTLKTALAHATDMLTDFINDRLEHTTRVA